MSIIFTTIKGDKELNYGYGMFRAYRIMLAKQLDPTLGLVYADTMMLLRNPNLFNQRFNEVIAHDKFRPYDDVLQFLCMPDCEGKISAKLCRRIATIMKDDDDELTEMIKWCANNRRKLVWH